MQDRVLRRAAGLTLPVGRDVLDDRVLSTAAEAAPGGEAPEMLTLRAGFSGYALSVAGCVVAVEGHLRGASVECVGRSRAFLVQGRSADLKLEIEWRELDAAPDGRPIFDSGGVWRSFRAGPETVLRFHDAALGAFPYKEARLDADGRRGMVLLDPRGFPPGKAVDPLEYPLDELLFQRLLGARGGIELHALGVVAPSGRGYVFAGQSGDGKTTTARMWQEAVGAAVLSDDRIVLTRDEGGGWRMHGTPWHGEAELALPASVPVAGVFVLARGARNSLESLSRARAVAALLARSFPAFADPRATAALLERIETLVAEVPCRLFPFVPGAGAVRYFLDHAP